MIFFNYNQHQKIKRALEVYTERAFRNKVLIGSRAFITATNCRAHKAIVESILTESNIDFSVELYAKIDNLVLPLSKPEIFCEYDKETSNFDTSLAQWSFILNSTKSCPKNEFSDNVKKIFRHARSSSIPINSLAPVLQFNKSDDDIKKIMLNIHNESSYELSSTHIESFVKFFDIVY